MCPSDTEVWWYIYHLSFLHIIDTFYAIYLEQSQPNFLLSFQKIPQKTLKVTNTKTHSWIFTTFDFKICKLKANKQIK